MTNEEAVAFALVAVKYLGLVNAQNALALEDEMTYLFDMYTGSEIIEKARKEVINESA